MDPSQMLATYTITDEDRGHVTGRLPSNWNEKAKLRRLGYETMAELVCERAHCTQALLARLNPGADLSRLRPGDTLTVPNREWLELPRAARIEINLSQKVIRCYGASNTLIALFHCSIARDAAKRPTGSAQVVAVAENPTYSFDPEMWPEVKNVRSKLLLQPGPNNPVGLCWIAISRKGYGIHGTPNPELIGKTGSHGCFRLTNWDAQRLGRMVQAGTPISFVR
jgi:lipoprotein-anchoring transpeptidase ErfK/SrfK